MTQEPLPEINASISLAYFVISLTVPIEPAEIGAVIES